MENTFKTEKTNDKIVKQVRLINDHGLHVLPPFIMLLFLAQS